ncbi:TPA: DeoR/GlpR transcriptional regulator [Enterococcus faecalis]|nr:DeoR/GlpR transcriptional regulator [Enterococcus faecalis]
MNKAERHAEISRLVHKKGTIRISDIVNSLNVTDMTVRRDLVELEEQGVLTKIHGGARSNKAFHYREFSHEEKHVQHIEEKRQIAKKAVEIIEEGDTIFLGPGTTVEALAEEIHNKKLTVITYCLPVFNILLSKKTDQFQVYLLGGEMRLVTSAFVGEITNTILEKMRFSKSFFSSNGIKGRDVMTSTFEEAFTQKLALKHSIEKYLLIDSSKIGKEDFTVFCDLSDLNAVVIDSLDDEAYKVVSPYTEVV